MKKSIKQTLQITEMKQLIACELLAFMLWIKAGYLNSEKLINQYYVFDGSGVWFGEYRTVGHSLDVISQFVYSISPNLIILVSLLGLISILGLIYLIFLRAGFSLALAFAIAYPLYSEFALQPIAISTFLGAIAYLILEKHPFISGYLLGFATSFHLSILGAGLWFLKGNLKIIIGFLLFILVGLFFGYDHISYSQLNVLYINIFIQSNEDYASTFRSVVFAIPWLLVAILASSRSKNYFAQISISVLMLLFGLKFVVSIERYLIPVLAFTFLTSKKGKYPDVLILSIAVSAFFFLAKLGYIKLF